jgi:hypothetical protein
MAIGDGASQMKSHLGNAKTLVRYDKIRYRKAHVKSAAAADATIYWFAVAAVATFLIAGIMVYRDATFDGRVASNVTRPMAVAETSSRVDRLPIHAHVEGVDP